MAELLGRREAFRLGQKAVSSGLNAFLTGFTVATLVIPESFLDWRDRVLAAALLLVVNFGLAMFKAIRDDRSRCAKDALESSHDLRVAVAMIEVRELLRDGRYLQQREATPGATRPDQDELHRWDGRVRRALHERWEAGVEKNYVDFAWTQDGRPIYGTQLGWGITQPAERPRAMPTHDR
jgi:hypothetical protein